MLNWWIVPVIMRPVSFVFIGVTIGLIFLGGLLGVYKGSEGSKVVCRYGQAVEDGVSNMWFLSRFSSQFIIYYPLYLGEEFLVIVDQGWLEVSNVWVFKLIELVEVFKCYGFFSQFFFGVLFFFPIVMWVL